MSVRRVLVPAAAALLMAWPAVAGVRARYGGELRVLVREAAQTTDPARLRSPSDVALAGWVHAPLARTASPAGRPELLSSWEAPEVAGGRLYRFTLRPGLRFQDGTPVDARSLIASFERLADPRLRSPFAALALPLVGAGDGTTRRISGLAAVGDLEVQVSLAFPYPDWALSLAHPAAAVVSAGEPGRLVGAGPFASGPRAGELVPFVDAVGGRPFLERVQVAVATPAVAARALAAGSTLAAMPVPARAAHEGPCLFATYLALNEERLKGRAGAVRGLVEPGLDRAELTRLFVRAPASALARLLPRALDPRGAEPRAALPAAARPAPNLVTGQAAVLVVDRSNGDQLAVAERLQLRLHRAGMNVELRRLERTELEEALGSRSYDLAVVSFALLPEPGMALAQLVDFAAGRTAAREELRRIGTGASVDARREQASARAAKLQPELPLVPLYEQCPLLVESPDLVGVGFEAAGVPTLADVWVD